MIIQSDTRDVPVSTYLDIKRCNEVLSLLCLVDFK